MFCFFIWLAFTAVISAPCRFIKIALSKVEEHQKLFTLENNSMSIAELEKEKLTCPGTISRKLYPVGRHILR